MQNEKKALRKVIQSCLKGLSQESKAAQSQSITNKIINLEAYKNAKSVAIYLPMTNEVSTYSLLDDIYKQGKLAFVPQIISPTEIDMVQVYSKNEIDQFPLDKWGIPIPINNEERNLWNHPERALDLIIVPGVGFDSTCNRLGHGKGFYGMYYRNSNHITRSLFWKIKRLVPSASQALPYSCRISLQISVDPLGSWLWSTNCSLCSRPFSW